MNGGGNSKLIQENTILFDFVTESYAADFLNFANVSLRHSSISDRSDCPASFQAAEVFGDSY